MQTHILNRLGHAAVTLAIVSVITFLIVNLSPGGFVIEGASGMSREDMERIRENLGLNLPLHVQYWRWSTGILTGDMANRSRMDRRLPNSSGNDWARRFHWRSSWVAGIGRLAFTSAFRCDYSVIMGITIVISVVVLLSNLLVDLLYAVVNPRVELG